MKRLIPILLAVLLLLPIQTWATLGVGISEPMSNASSSATSASVTSTNGSSFVVCAATDGALSTPTDSKANGYSPLAAELTLAGGQHNRCWVKHNGTGGASHTFTISGAGTATSGCVVEITRTGTVSTDKVDRVEDTSTPFTSPGVTTTVADEILIGFISLEGGADIYAFDVTGGSFTKQDEVQDGNNFYPVACSTRTVSSTGTYNTSTTTSSGLETSTADWIMTFTEGAVGVTCRGGMLLMGVGGC